MRVTEAETTYNEKLKKEKEAKEAKEAAALNLTNPGAEFKRVVSALVRADVDCSGEDEGVERPLLL